jgi:hypothetical protein
LYLIFFFTSPGARSGAEEMGQCAGGGSVQTGGGSFQHLVRAAAPRQARACPCSWEVKLEYKETYKETYKEAYKRPINQTRVCPCSWEVKLEEGGGKCPLHRNLEKQQKDPPRIESSGALTFANVT